MYIKLNNTKYADVKRSSYRSIGKVVYVGNSLTGITEVSGEIEVYRDDDFLLCVDHAEDYARQIIADGVVTLTNEPEPVEPEPSDPVEPVEDVTWEAMAEAITEGVNEV